MYEGQPSCCPCPYMAALSTVPRPCWFAVGLVCNSAYPSLPTPPLWGVHAMDYPSLPTPPLWGVHAMDCRQSAAFGGFGYLFYLGFWLGQSLLVLSSCRCCGLCLLAPCTSRWCSYHPCELGYMSSCSLCFPYNAVLHRSGGVLALSIAGGLSLCISPDRLSCRVYPCAFFPSFLVWSSLTFLFSRHELLGYIARHRMKHMVYLIYME